MFWSLSILHMCRKNVVFWITCALFKKLSPRMARLAHSLAAIFEVLFAEPPDEAKFLIRQLCWLIVLFSDMLCFFPCFKNNRTRQWYKAMVQDNGTNKSYQVIILSNSTRQSYQEIVLAIILGNHWAIVLGNHTGISSNILQLNVLLCDCTTANCTTPIVLCVDCTTMLIVLQLARSTISIVQLAVVQSV